ncbi:MAG: transposase, partial [Clostridiaceae bacterium]|nr:transposase [Clostridiaceae bacterium]
PRELRAMLNAYMPHYNQVRPHSSLDGFVPATRYLGQPLTQVG